jgi:hypothetical protein
VVVYPSGGDIRVPEPFLYLGNVGLVVERICRGGCAQRVGADLEPERRRIAAHQLVDGVGGQRLVELARAVIADRPEQRTVFVAAVPGSR